MNENNYIKYEMYETPKGKKIEVIPDGQYGLYTIHPHGTNLPEHLKGQKFTSRSLASAAILNWIKSINERQKEEVEEEETVNTKDKKVK
jgi:hypothetical protein